MASEPLKLVVCWENPDAAEPLPGEPNQASGAERREWVRLALKRTWEREARILFVGWEQCQDEENATPPPHTLGPRRPGTTDENIKINIQATGGGQNPGHGSWGDHQQGGVLLNLHLTRGFIEYLAIHEFGHVLGFYHEEERSDWPNNIPGCPQQTWPPTDPWWPVPIELRWGAPDRNSIMAYCAGSPTVLSPGDVAAVQRAYERHIPGTLLSLPGSLCLSAHANAANGDNAFGWACDEALDDQEWRYDPDRQALYIMSPTDPNHTRRCLDLDTTNNSDVQIWDCHYGANQQWKFQRVTIRGYGGLCLTRHGDGSLTMEQCNSTTEQLWKVTQSPEAGYVRLQSDSGSLCLTRIGDSGSNAVVLPCTTHTIYLPLILRSTGVVQARATGEMFPVVSAAIRVQDFIMLNGGRIVGVEATGNLCLDVRDVWDADYTDGKGGPVAGQNVQFFQCTQTQLNQRWSLSGDVISGYRCLELANGGLTNGAAAFLARCDGDAEQDWDYNW
ncbi:MAG: ricin-type beta-trefoil lectin domain protein [Anaerolineae bacterium]